MQINSLKSLSILFFSLLATLLLIRNSSAIDTLDWPYEILTDKGEITVYQPQLESFTDDKISSRAAVSVQKGEEEPVFGAMWMDARVSTDRNTRQVKFLGVKVTNVKFPDATEEQIAEFKQIIESHVPEEEIYISLDHLLTMLELVEKEKAIAEDLNTDPPRIIFVTHPAMLVFIDGEPKLQKIENTQIMRVINTPFTILFDTKSKTYYLLAGKDWMKASNVMGPWTFEPKPPSMVVITAARFSEPDTDTSTESTDLKKSELIITTEPAELIVSEGEPAYTHIQDTNLLYMSSTDSDVFMEIDSQKYFVLLSGRWYTGTSLNGPWTYVAADSLPADFAMIPEGSEKARVLSSVAGTEEAKEAVLDAQIPQTAAIDRNEVDVTVEYDGSPQFEPIETTKMYYAANTGYSVIRVGNRYYLCDEAVWYESGSPNGPWIVSISVPQVIYTIPPSSPVYHVRYVYVYDYTPEVVYVGYYPGYVGGYIYGPTVIYGTGWYYRPWYRHRYYPRPYTWGVAVRYNSYTGGWGVRVGYGGPVGWYGYGRLGWVGGSRWYHRGYRNIHHERSITTRRGTITRETDIKRRRYGDIDIDRNISFEPNENFYDKKKKRREAREGKRGERPGTPEDRRARGSDRRRDERSSIPEDRQRDRIDREQQPSRLDRDKSRKRAETGKSQRHTTRKSRYDKIYADRDGNVYRRTDQGWEKRNRSGWSRTQPSQQTSKQQAARQRTSTRQPTTQPSTRQQTTTRQRTTTRQQQATTRQTQQQITRQKTQKRQKSYDRRQADLNRHYQARERGTQRTRNYQQAKSHSRSRSGGASRGARGGGGRR